jgi:two-component system sensor histidine kinase PilS (NtrC family)
MALACAILVAAVFVWNRTAPSDTRIATLAFAAATLATVGSALFTQVRPSPPGPWFYGGQCAIDLLLVTALVHITGGWSSQFTALYILVIASAALLLPLRGGLAVAASACALYAVDVLWLRHGVGTPFVGVGVQVAVFGVVAVGAGYVALRLRQAGSGREALAAQLAKVQLEAAEILRTIRSGIITVDAQGRLLYANPAAGELLGLDLRALTGTPLLPSLTTVSPRLADLLERSARDRIRTTRAEGIIRRGAEDVAIGVTTTVADGARPDGGVTATAIFQDISDSKRLQSLHVRAERLQAVAELSASLAHEIRNPLAAIRSATEQLSRLRVPSPTDDDDERTLHELIVREADRLSRLLADFLDFARTQVARLDALEVGALVRTAAMLAASHPDRGPSVQLQVDIADGLPRLNGDEDLLHRAVFNLVLNAIQAVGRVGHVVVAVDRRPAEGINGSSIAVTGDLIAITVTDDGPGIPEELKDRLFEPFVSGKAGGTGLGLPVVHRAVEAHGGVVLVDRLAKGTRFCVVLPVTPAMPTPPASLNDRLTGGSA